MRIAVIADIHGNADALEAVLRELESARPVDRFLVLGDLVAFGPDAVPVVERLKALPELTCISGNGDRWVVSSAAPLPPPDRRTDDGLRGTLNVVRACGWAAGQLASAGLLDWLGSLPPTARLDLPNGERLLAVHGSPSSDEEGIGERMPAERLAEIAGAAEAELILSGHTHLAFEAAVGRTVFHTIASASNPKGHDRAAAYAVLDATAVGFRISRRSAAYDTTAVIARARALRHPALDLLERVLGG